MPEFQIKSASIDSTRPLTSHRARMRAKRRVAMRTTSSHIGTPHRHTSRRRQGASPHLTTYKAPGQHRATGCASLPRLRSACAHAGPMALVQDGWC
eukprot:scaffold37546_cov57-Phaeocystis_antarctica.AAC.2